MLESQFYKVVTSAIVACACMMFAASAAHAIPALQLGPDGTGWTYDFGTQTWVNSENPFSMLATANATTGNGDYAWENTGTTQTAYLVVATVPDTGMTDQFDVTVVNDAAVLALFDSGYGTPPIEDPNSLAPHGIFSTYFEIYAFQFDGSVTTISDTQPGGSGTGDGFEELFDVTVNFLATGVTALHFDLFTVAGNGIYDPDTQQQDRFLVEAFAPFSHDAQSGPGPGNGPGPGPAPAPPFDVPEPVTATMGIMAMAALSTTMRRRR